MDSFLYTFPISGVTAPLWLPPTVAAGIAFFTSMVGISGAFLLVPFQLSVLGFASPSASATNLVYNLFSIPGALWRYQREGRLFWPLTLVVTAGGAPGTFLGAWLRTHYLAERATFELFVAVILAWLGGRMVMDVLSRHSNNNGQAVSAVQLVETSGWTVRYQFAGMEHTFPIVPMLGLSFLVGVVGTAYGIGGGSFIVPLCLTLYRLPLHSIAGASLAATLLTSAIALVAYAWLPAPPGVAARPDWLLGIAYGVGGLVGAYFGARCQKLVPQKALKVLLAVVLLGLAVRYIWPGT